ncbi:MAG TPA: 2-phospho-L-lactate transferase [Caulobacterales bacterium]|nr:2-phospho-L-lactate transferase [Caulobacterales bacterium]
MILCLSGGVGGAKLVLGLSRVLDADTLVVAVNTGDDFLHLGLEVWPDFDTTLYTLAGVANAEQGWGRAAESWRVMDELRTLRGEIWFNLGDKDIALHLLRAQLRAGGRTASEIAAILRDRFSVAPQVTPATDQAVRTIVHSNESALPFQHYFVRDRAEPPVTRLSYEGAASASFAPPILAALHDPRLEAIVIAPSNPFLSIAPILAIAGAREVLRGAGVPIVAVTPIIAGAAVKGPTAKIMRELGLDASAAAIAAHYEDLIDGFVLDQADVAQRAAIESRGIMCAVEQTLMREDADKIALGERVLAFAKRCPLRARI